MKSEAEMLKYRNFGKKSLNEIKDKLSELGLALGMKFDPSLLEASFSRPILHSDYEDDSPGLMGLLGGKLRE
jgi:DNA-directed RNA polymerase subunit alpha